MFDISQIAPFIDQLGKIEPHLCKDRKSHIRFCTNSDTELINLARCFNGEVKKLWATLSQMYSTSFSKKCRDRYNNYIKKHVFTPQEDELIVKKVNEIGTNWKVIAHCIGNVKAKQVQNRYAQLNSAAKKAIAQENVIIPDDTVAFVVDPKQQVSPIFKIDDIDKQIFDQDTTARNTVVPDSPVDFSKVDGYEFLAPRDTYTDGDESAADDSVDF